MKPRTIQILATALFALLVLWGAYTLIVYLGITYHIAALTTEEATKAAVNTCGEAAYFCKGMVSIVPVFTYVLVRAAPFLWYAIICALVYAFYIGFQVTMRNSGSTLHITWRPWKVLVLALACLWLLSTVINFGTENGRPVQLYIEPTKQTYNVDDNTLVALQTDYKDLLARGCLDDTDQVTTSGGKVHRFNIGCIEQAFVTRVLPQVLFVLLLLFEFLALGRMLLREVLMRLSKKWNGQAFSLPSLGAEALVSVGLGACASIVLLWIIAACGVYVSAAGWLLAIAIPVACFPHAFYWIKQLWEHEWEREYKWWDLSLVLGWLLISYIALNFLEVVRPFPIGWDDLGSYLNRPRLLVSYGSFIHLMSPFDWSYLTSLGFLLFGYNATFGSTAAMMVNWSAGLLATLSVFVFAKTFLGKRAGFLSALLYYSLPMVGHFSFADMKIDNAIFFFTTLAAFCLFFTLLPPPEETMDPEVHPEKTRTIAEWPLLFLAGLFLGFAFATKATAAMAMFALAAVLIGLLLHSSAFVGGIALAFVAFATQGVLSFSDVANRISGATAENIFGTIFVVGCIVIGIACLGFAFWKRTTRFRTAAVLCGAFALGLLLATVPWIEHNNLLAGRIIPRMEMSAPDTLSPKINIRALTGPLAIDRNAPACSASGAREELDRYWGFDSGWSHYLTLPWRVVMNIDATSYYVTTIPALLLFPLLLLMPYFWTRRGRWLRWLTWATGMMLLEWMFLANGIPWYGVSMLLGLMVGLEALVIKAPDRANRIVIGILLSCSLFIAFGLRFWQYEQQRNVFEYSMGKISAESMRWLTIPYYQPISDTVVARSESIPDRPYLYRIGTFIPYFIPKNLQIIGINDNQLDTFNCLYAERKPELTIARLKAMGFNSIIFDTNTATIERDEQGSLHQKVNAFVDFVNDPKNKLGVALSDLKKGVAFILIP